MTWLLAVAVFTALASPEPKWQEALASVGIKTSVSCESKKIRTGKAGSAEFSEISLRCGSNDIAIEVTKPIDLEAFKRHLANQSVKLSETYSAGRNPYTGFVSDTAMCPPGQNFFSKDFKTSLQILKVHIGRMTERKVWGGCGKSDQDIWGAAASIHHKAALIDVTIKSSAKLSRKSFEKQVENFLAGLESN